MAKKLFFISLFFGLLLSNNLAQIVITNSHNPENEISSAQLRNIFIGNKISWGDGSLIHLADYSAESKIRQKFSNEYLDLTPRKVSMLWIKVSLSGKSVPPQIFRDENELIEYIKNNERAIGYISNSSKLPSGIKVLKIN